MSNLFKDIYNVGFYNQLSKVLNQSLAGFNSDEFNRLIFTPAFDNLGADFSRLKLIKMFAKNDLVVDTDKEDKQWVVGLYDETGHNQC